MNTIPVRPPPLVPIGMISAIVLSTIGVAALAQGLRDAWPSRIAATGAAAAATGPAPAAPRRFVVDVVEVDAAAPKPPPKPTPQPGPPVKPDGDGDVDPTIREAAAAFFKGYIQLYADVPARLADESVNYNDVTQAQLQQRKVLSLPVGWAIDAVTAPLYDDQLRFKDPKVAAAAYRKVAASLAAGIRDAAK